MKTARALGIYRSCHLREERFWPKTLLKYCQLVLCPAAGLQSVPAGIRRQTTDRHLDHEIDQSGVVCIEPSKLRQSRQILQGACEIAIVQVVDRRSM